MPHDSPLDQLHLVLSATGKALPQAPGLSGGYPANTQYDVLVRGSDVNATLQNGRIPRVIAELGGEPLIMPAHLETSLAADDVYYTHWQGGGGYGDPLLRQPASVAGDLERQRVSPEAARTLYGVVFDAAGRPDEDATGELRDTLRRRRAGLDEDADLSSPDQAKETAR